MLRQLVAKVVRRLSRSWSRIRGLTAPPPLDPGLEGFQGDIAIRQTPDNWNTGCLAVVKVEVRNTGTRPWPAHGPQAVCLGYHWRKPGLEQPVVQDDGHRSLLPVGVAPGQTLTTWCGVQTPGTLGPHDLELDLFRYFGGWFGGEAAVSSRHRVEVEGLAGEGHDPRFNYHDFYRQANLHNDYWSVVGPRSLEEFERLGQGKLKLLVDGGLTPDARVLDVGCGTGQLTGPLMTYLSDRGAYVGTDLAAEAIAFCRTKYARPNFRFFQNDMTALPLTGESFDAIYLGSVFTHMFPDEIAGMLTELRRLLDSGGFILADAFHSSLVGGHTPSRALVEINETLLFDVFARSGLQSTKIKSWQFNTRTQRTIFKFSHAQGFQAAR